MSVAFRRGRPSVSQIGDNLGYLASNIFSTPVGHGPELQPAYTGPSQSRRNRRDRLNQSIRERALSQRRLSYDPPSIMVRRRYKTRKGVRRVSRRRGARRSVSRRVFRRGVTRSRGLRRGRRFGRRVRRSGVRARSSIGSTLKTNVRAWPPSNGVTSGIYAQSVYGSFSSAPGDASSPSVNGVAVVSNGLYPTTPAPSTFSDNGLAGISFHPWFHTNLAFRLADFPASFYTSWYRSFRYWRFGRCIFQFAGRGAANVYSGADAQGTPSEIVSNPGVARGGDLCFTVTSKTGPVPLAYGFYGSHTNADAISQLHNFPFYRLINAPAALRRKSTLIRRNAAFGMKPVVLKFIPRRYKPVLQYNYGVGNTPYPATSVEISSTRVDRRQTGPPWNPTYDLRQDNAVGIFLPDPFSPYEWYHGVSVSTRPGSWTKTLFPYLSMRVWVRVHFKSRRIIRDSENQTYEQMNFGGPMLIT